MTPEKLLTGGRMWLRGIPITHIAAELDVAEGTFRYHLDKRIKPRFEDDFLQAKSIEAAKVAELERVAWAKFEESEKPQTKERKKFATSAALTGLGVKPQLVERVFEEIGQTGEVAWLDLVRWAIDWRCKINGYYAAEKHDHRLSGEADIRVAGLTPAELDTKAIERLNRLRAEREVREQARIEREVEG